MLALGILIEQTLLGYVLMWITTLLSKRDRLKQVTTCFGVVLGKSKVYFKTSSIIKVHR